ncbi:MAG: hypothetical protein R6X18_17520 [Chloroflexota bacterium]|jgi:hypothetical protein
MLHTDRDSILAIVASMLVLFSAMISPVLTVALVVMVSIAIGIYRLAGRLQLKYRDQT